MLKIIEVKKPTQCLSCFKHNLDGPTGRKFYTLDVNGHQMDLCEVCINQIKVGK